MHTHPTHSHAGNPHSAGASGPEVLWMQQCLNSWLQHIGDSSHHLLVEDGKLGPRTRAVVVHFQQAYGLHPSGAADEETLAALQQLFVPQEPDPAEVSTHAEEQFAQPHGDAPVSHEG